MELKWKRAGDGVYTAGPYRIERRGTGQHAWWYASGPGVTGTSSSHKATIQAECQRIAKGLA